MSGAEGNVAIAMARLGHNAQWVGTLGPDTFGEGILRTLRGERVGVDFVERREEQTGLLVVRGIGIRGEAGGLPPCRLGRLHIFAGAGERGDSCQAANRSSDRHHASAQRRRSRSELPTFARGEGGRHPDLVRSQLP